MFGYINIISVISCGSCKLIDPAMFGLQIQSAIIVFTDLTIIVFINRIRLFNNTGCKVWETYIFRQRSAICFCIFHLFDFLK